MNTTQISITFALVAATLSASGVVHAAQKLEFAPRADEQQLPRAMHSQMKQRPAITVGLRDADIVGADNRALQAAVDYIAGLGGGTVEIGAGEFVMHDSLHLRSFVTVRGVEGKTILRKAKAAESPLALDGDYGEEQITVINPDGFKVGYGVAIWDSQSGGFHTTVARITGQNGNTVSLDTPLNADCMVANKAQAATIFPSSVVARSKVRVWKTSLSTETRLRIFISTGVVAEAFFSTADSAPSLSIASCGTFTATASVSSNPTMFWFRAA
jgi:hypothetical protein